MDDTAKEASGAILSGLLFGFLIGLILEMLLNSPYWVGFHDGNTGMKEAAIDHEFGLYCPDTGKFAWKDECTK
jgi:hypothetical protein